MRTFFTVLSVLLILLSSWLVVADKMDIAIYSAICGIYFLLLSEEEN